MFLSEDRCFELRDTSVLRIRVDKRKIIRVQRFLTIKICSSGKHPN